MCLSPPEVECKGTPKINMFEINDLIEMGK